jgi:hypothetical protein
MLIVGCFDSIAISSINDQRDVCRHFEETHELITVLERGRQFNIPAIIMREYTDYANEHFPQRKSLPPTPNAFAKRPRSSLSRPSSAASESNENKRGRPILPFEENSTEAEIERLQRSVDRMLKQHKLLDESTRKKQQVVAGQLRELKNLNANIDTTIKRLRELNETIQDSRACRSLNQQAVKMYYVLSDGRGGEIDVDLSNDGMVPSFQLVDNVITDGDLDSSTIDPPEEGDGSPEGGDGDDGESDL